RRPTTPPPCPGESGRGRSDRRARASPCGRARRRRRPPAVAPCRAARRGTRAPAVAVCRPPRAPRCPRRPRAPGAWRRVARGAPRARPDTHRAPAPTGSPRASPSLRLPYVQGHDTAGEPAEPDLAEAARGEQLRELLGNWEPADARGQVRVRGAPGQEAAEQ